MEVDKDIKLFAESMVTDPELKAAYETAIETFFQTGQPVCVVTELSVEQGAFTQVFSNISASDLVPEGLYFDEPEQEGETDGH